MVVLPHRNLLLGDSSEKNKYGVPLFGASISALGRLSGRSHVAVKQAIELAKTEQKRRQANE